MLHATFRPLDAADARIILSWRYEGPYAVYNPPLTNVDAAVAVLIDPANAYFAARDADETVIGFCCFGTDAQVPGGDYSDPTPLDVGLGLRPDLTGRGRGAAFLLAVLDFGRARFAPACFRLTVAAFNERARKIYERAGFHTRERFRRGGTAEGAKFLVLVEALPGEGDEPSPLPPVNARRW